MKFWQTSWFHKIATAVVTAGAFVAHYVIPDTASVTLGSATIPVSSLVAGGLALAAAQGITPNRQVQTALESAVKK